MGFFRKDKFISWICGKVVINFMCMCRILVKEMFFNRIGIVVFVMFLLMWMESIILGFILFCFCFFVSLEMLFGVNEMFYFMSMMLFEVCGFVFILLICGVLVLSVKVFSCSDLRNVG